LGFNIWGILGFDGGNENKIAIKSGSMELGG